MDKYTHFEDLSTEIFFEILDYLDVLDIFISFTSLNKRITSILKSIPLRLIIPYSYCRKQVDYLSSYLTHHSDQVISLDIFDTIRDDTSIISLLFYRHKFPNLQSCTLKVINSCPKLKYVIKNIRKLNKLASFCIHQTNTKVFSENDRCNLTHTMLTHKSTLLQSLTLNYPFHYHDLVTYRSLPSNLTSLTLTISNPTTSVPVRSILLILRLCQKIQFLSITSVATKLHDNNNANISNQAQLMTDNNDFIISTEMKFFNLLMLDGCDIRSVGYILRCMPKLVRFVFVLGKRARFLSYPGELLDGHVWKQMFELYVPCLSTFEFHISFVQLYLRFDLDLVVHSFECLVQKYSNWHMVIDRWELTNFQRRSEYVMLRTLNFHKHNLHLNCNLPLICNKTFETRSTTSINDHYIFYSKEDDLHVPIIDQRSNVTCSSPSPLFRHVSYLTIHMPISSSSLFNNLINIMNFRQLMNDNDAEQCVTDLSNFVYLPNVTEINFESSFRTTHWKYIQFILQACSNIKNLIIDSRLLFASKIIDNPKLLSIFKQINRIESIRKDIYFSTNFGLKLVERCPSLTHIQLRTYSFDHCAFLIDLFPSSITKFILHKNSL